MKKIFVIFICLSLAVVNSFAQDFKNHVMPSIGFDALQTGEEDFILNPSVNLQYMRIKNEGVESKQPDFLMLGAGYSQNYFTAGIGPDKINTVHGCNLMVNLGKADHSFMAMLASGGEAPFSHIKTITAATMYTRRILDTENISFVFGAGVIVADLGLELFGYDIYVLPLPVFSFTYKNDIISGTIALMGPPRISFTLFPKSMFRFNGNLGMAGLSSIRKLLFDCALAWYPLNDSENPDMLSLSLGVMNTENNTVLKDKEKYGYQYYSVYGEVDAAFVKLRGGYNFDGKVIARDEYTKDMYKGFFGSLNAMFMF